MNKVAQVFGILFVLVLAIAMFAFIPLATIWAINTLFATGIAYTFYTWLAVVVLNLTVLVSFRFKGD